MYDVNKEGYIAFDPWKRNPDGSPSQWNASATSIALKASEVHNNEARLLDIENLIVDSPGYSHELVLKIMMTAWRPLTSETDGKRAVVDKVYFNDPRIFNDPALKAFVQFRPGFNGLYHVQLRKPSLIPTASYLDPQTSEKAALMATTIGNLSGCGSASYDHNALQQLSDDERKTLMLNCPVQADSAKAIDSFQQQLGEIGFDLKGGSVVPSSAGSVGLHATQSTAIPTPLAFSLFESFDIQARLQQFITRPVLQALSGNEGITLTEFNKKLQGAAENFSENGWTVNWKPTAAIKEQEFTIKISADATKTLSINFSPGPMLGRLLGLDSSQNVGMKLTLSFKLNATLGVRMSTGLAAEDAAFFKIEEASVELAANDILLPDLAVDMGLAALSVSGGEVARFSLKLDFGFKNPTNPTLREWTASSTQPTISLTGRSAKLDMSLPIFTRLAIPGLDLGAGTEIKIKDDDLFNGDSISTLFTDTKEFGLKSAGILADTAKFGEVLNFKDFSALQLVGLLRQFGDFLEQIVVPKRSRPTFHLLAAPTSATCLICAAYSWTRLRIS